MRFFLVLLLVSALPLSAGAHAFGVSHEETTTEGVHVDIGYSAATPSVGEAVIFDFNLPVGEEDEVYTDVWVRVENKEGAVVLATAVHNAEFGGPRMSYVFPKAGEYAVHARYENEGDAVARTEWPLTVVPAKVGGFTEKIPWLLVFFGGVLLGAFGAYVLSKRVLRMS